MSFVTNAAHSIRESILHLYAMRSEKVDGICLPPRSLRFCGREFRNNKFYLESGFKEVDRLVEKCGLTEDAFVLDIGCGPGRLAIALRHRFPSLRRYLGVDVHAPSIRWCRRHFIDSEQFQFVQLGMKNERYNPSANQSHPRTLPRAICPPGSVNVINLFSVFSHLPETDISFYLREFEELLASDGRVFLTAFLKQGAAKEVAENPIRDGQEWSGPLHCVELDYDWFTAQVESTGFSLSCGPLHSEIDGQTAVYLQRVNATMQAAPRPRTLESGDNVGI